MDDMSDFLFQNADDDNNISQNVVDTLIEAANTCTQNLSTPDLSTPDLSLTGELSGSSSFMSYFLVLAIVSMNNTNHQYYPQI